MSRRKSHDEPLLEGRDLEHGEEGSPGGGGRAGVRLARATPGSSSFRLTRRSPSVGRDAHDGEEAGGAGSLALQGPPEGGEREGVHEVEVEVLTEAVAEAVGAAVHEAVQEAVQDAVAQAIEEHVQFDVRANVYTLVAVSGVILYWRGVWNTWDSLLGTGLASNLASIVVGLTIMMIIRITNVPLVQGLPGG